MTRRLLAALVALHGIVHLIGFVVPWRIAEVTGFPYRTTLLDGAPDLGDLGVRVVGLVWLACSIGFVVAAVGIARRSSWGRSLTVALAAASLVVCLLWIPETAAGIGVNLAILTGTAWMAREGAHTPQVAS